MLPRNIEETDHWSPPQKEVDTCIDSLEYELSQESEQMRERSGLKRNEPAPTKVIHQDSFTLFWVMLAIAGGCFWWLAAIMVKAVN